MTATICHDERAFQSALDERPDDLALKATFADWLEERGDWRAVGYRWMAKRVKWPRLMFVDEADELDEFNVVSNPFWFWNYSENNPDAHDVLPFGVANQHHLTRQNAEEWLCRIIAECQV